MQKVYYVVGTHIKTSLESCGANFFTVPTDGPRFNTPHLPVFILTLVRWTIWVGIMIFFHQPIILVKLPSTKITRRPRHGMMNSFTEKALSTDFKHEEIMTKPEVIRTEKTVDVVFMKEKIDGESILRGILDSYDDLGQNSYVKHTVGESDDSDFWFKLDEILIKKYGLKDQESIILLVWW